MKNLGNRHSINMKKSNRKRILKDLAKRLWVKGVLVRNEMTGEDIPLTPQIWKDFKDGLLYIKPILKHPSHLTKNQIEKISSLVLGPDGELDNENSIRVSYIGDITLLLVRETDFKVVQSVYDFLIQEGYDTDGLIDSGLAYDRGRDKENY